MSFVFDKSSPSPLNKRFKICFKSFLSLLRCKKQSQKCYKRDIFLILHFGRQASWEEC